ncbi:MAG TPA: hypothetical protein VNI52_04915 [Sphingobacteriaceae bacterium]|nr:hypothetical protein [Sphingobacteriaceae bacterium]
MTPKNKTIRIILLTIFGIWFTVKLYKSAENDFIFDGFVFLFIGIVGLSIFIWTIFKDLKEFKTSRKLKSYLPTFIGLIFILANIGLFYYQENKANLPTLISGFNDGGFNGFSVDFKTDGTYVMANGSGLGQSYFYGTYTLKDSITLDKSNIDNCIRTNKLVIRNESYFQKDSVELIKSKANYITQVDKNGNETNKEFRFRVIADNRIK